MKNTIVLTIAIVLAVIIVGCATPGTVTQTTTPGTPAITNQVTGVVTPATPPTVILVTNYVANPTVTTVASTIATASPFVPQPWGVILGGVGLLIGAVGSGIAGWKNAQANLHQSTLQAVVTGIENSIPGVLTAIQTTTPAAAGNPTAAQAMATANSVLSAVKASITSTTNATKTADNLNTQLASSGIGPSAL